MSIGIVNKKWTT